MTAGRMSGALSGRLSGRLAGSPEGAQGATPEDYFDASKLVDWWRADTNYTTVGVEINSWSGNKRGIQLSGVAANYCALTEANANFNGQPTIDTSEAGTNGLRVTALATPIWTTTQKPHILVVARATGYTSGTDCLLAFSDAPAVAATTRIDVSAAGTFRFRAVRDAISNDRTAAVTITTPALIKAGVDHDDASAGLTFAHNATSSSASATNLELDLDVTYMSIGSTTVLTNFGSFEIAEIVLLNDDWTAQELTDYSAYTLSRYGVPP